MRLSNVANATTASQITPPWDVRAFAWVAAVAALQIRKFSSRHVRRPANSGADRCPSRHKRLPPATIVARNQPLVVAPRYSALTRGVS
jgi:hypothetical protein